MFGESPLSQIVRFNIGEGLGSWLSRRTRGRRPTRWRVWGAVLTASCDVDCTRAGALQEIGRLSDTGWREEDQDRSCFPAQHGRIGDARTLELGGKTAAFALQDSSVWAVTRPMHGRQRTR